MNLEQLRTAGGFVALDPVKVPVAWKAHNFDVFVRQLSFGDVERLTAAENSTVALIAASVLLGEERTPLAAADAERLDVSLATKLLEAINLVNAGADPKN
ncbi:phage tail assembly chaperone family protein, TAC [Accumulibacter sp.]|uniref:phage tail assembly chaperone family protein, TAC n=1 Tax=Accumulibacter sp. TaxID=2053492 RepID=UPI001ACD587E|nr:phage tail assembly chaperone family protein, TAC [Accumulibacter sp.]MBN8515283.1 phage tail assembly chaperone family protein, TAC [Accumulibacter sp.]MBO3701574.1 phage tail assembly chaperone family protein, TAC [Accumulibacter sp.]